MSEFILEVNDISKSKGEHDILRGAEINVRSREIVSVLGAKYSGKTTLLKIIAGFDEPDSGSVIADGKSLTRIPPYKRGFCSVFSDSVLFPNMTVAENIAYPLRIRGYSSEEVRENVRNIINLAKLTGLEKLKPSALSPSQYKMTLIARAAVTSPSVLLLDEPFVSFLSHERTQGVIILKSIKKELDISIVCATADPEVAMQLSDRVFILRSGRIEQSGPPSYLYTRPRTAAAAKLMGLANIIKGRVVSTGEFIMVDTGNELISVHNTNYNTREGMPVTMCIRPENVHLSTRTVGNSIKGTIVEQVFSSSATTVRIKSGSTEVYHIMTGMSRFDEGDTVYAEFDPNRTILVDIIEPKAEPKADAKPPANLQSQPPQQP